MSVKSWAIKLFLGGKLPGWIYRLTGKKLAEKLNLQEGNMDETKKWYQSKAVLSAIIGAILAAVQPVSNALGHPIVIPTWVFEILGSMGLYALRTGDKPIA